MPEPEQPGRRRSQAWMIARAAARLSPAVVDAGQRADPAWLRRQP
jgi:hypothetical protein